VSWKGKHGRDARATEKQMAHTKHNSLAAVAYATSLLDLANDSKQAQAIGTELAALGEIIRQNPSFGAFLSDPGIRHEERTEMMDKVWGGKVTPLMKSFLGVVNLKNAMRKLPEIADAYDDLLDEQQGKVEVDVTVAQKLSPEQLEQVRQRVGAALGKDAVVHQYVDESIIGGLVLRVQDKLIDASVRNQLQAMREQLLSARPA
jgi:F-type H+-transporting ATPase subunit delta